MNYTKLLIVSIAMLIIPMSAYAQTTGYDSTNVNGSDRIGPAATDDPLGSLMPEDDYVGSTGRVNELEQSRIELSGIMSFHAEGEYHVAEDLVFAMTYVDTEAEKLVVFLDPILLSLDLEYDEADIHELLGEQVPIALKYGTFKEESHDDSSVSLINAWIQLYNSRCDSPSDSSLCTALTHNIRDRNHYTLDATNSWIPPTGSYNPIYINYTSSVIFEDFFEGNLSAWSQTGDKPFKIKVSDESSTYPTNWRADNTVAESENCDDTCSMNLAHSIDLSSYASATLEFDRFASTALDAGEGLKVELYDGTSWTKVLEWSKNSGDADSTWRHVSYDLGDYLVDGFDLRITAESSRNNEHVAIDNVQIFVNPNLIYMDTFESGISDWVHTTDSNRNFYSRISHESDEYPSGWLPSNKVAESDNCDYYCRMELRDSINMTSYDAATLEFDRFVDASFDTGEYLRIQLYNGTWNTAFEWKGNTGDDDSEWHHEVLDLSDYLVDDFKIKVIARSTSSSEEAAIDNVKITEGVVPRATIGAIYDNFEQGMSWTQTGNTNFVSKVSDVSSSYPDHWRSTNKVAESENCDYRCSMEYTGINLANYSSAILSLDRFLSANVDSNEYLRVELYNGTWNAAFEWSGRHGDDDSTWHKELFVLDDYLVEDFGIRVTARSDQSNEHMSIDNFEIFTLLNGNYSLIPPAADADEYYGGNELIVRTNNVTHTFSGSSTITIGAVSDGLRGIVVSGHSIELQDLDSIFDHYSLRSSSQGITELVTPRQLPVAYGSNVDAGFIPIIQSDVRVESQVQYNNGTVLSVTGGSVSPLAILDRVDIFGVRTNDDGQLLYKNVTIHEHLRGVFFPNMALASYSSAPGDSGAPIIYHNDTRHEIVGVHMGVICEFGPLTGDEINVCERNPNYFKVFSPWENVQRALNLD